MNGMPRACDGAEGQFLAFLDIFNKEKGQLACVCSVVRSWGS